MSTLDEPPYGLPPALSTDNLWMNWDESPPHAPTHSQSISSQDFIWQPPLFSFPEYYSLPLNHWSSQCAAPLSTALEDPQAKMTQSPESPVNNMVDWFSSSNSYESAAPSPASLSSGPLCSDQVDQYDTLQEQAQQDYFEIPPADKSSRTHRKKSSSALSSSFAPPNPKRAHYTKTPIRCFEHSCGGRAFSSPGNYERHLREKSGRAKSFSCELCGQKFTRSTARNKHVRYGRCRMRPGR